MAGRSNRRIVSPAGAAEAGPTEEDRSMYATIHEFRGPAGNGPALREAVARCLPPGAEPAGVIALDLALHPGCGTVVALWAEQPAVDDRIYRVSDDMQGRAAGRRPLFAQVIWLNGDGDPARAEAAEHGGRHRIWPAVKDIDGIVGTLALRSPDDRIVVVGLATGTESHEQVQRAVMSTALLPDEDPALLRRADRIDMARVLFAQLPTAVRS
jgi:hypothetical protein